jgi:acetoin utilization deacetylase AcuC-like enzyme
MLCFLSDAYREHNPQYEYFRGEKVPCFESVERLDNIVAALQARGHECVSPQTDASSVIAKIHDPAYVSFITHAWQEWLALDEKNHELQPFPSVWPTRTLRDDIVPDNFIAKLGLYSMDNGTPLAAGTWRAAKSGADAAVSAANYLLVGHSSVFSASRPPGHHAGRDFMGGYCFLNNAALAAQALLDQGMKKVVVLDIDYHHGNGTQSLFYDRDDVLFISIHGDPKTEYPFYLGHADEIGEGAGQGYNVNFPLPIGTTFTQWLSALEKAIERIQDFQADALVISLGLDTFEGDPISKFTITSEDYFQVGQQLASLKLPTAFIMEGGYATEALGTNVVNVLDGFEQA